MEGNGEGEAPPVKVAPVKPVAAAAPTPALPAALAPGAEWKPAPEYAEEHNGNVNHPPLDAILAHWRKHRENTGEHFEPNEVREAYQQFEAGRDGHGAWMWGKRQVGDWRAAMQQRMLGNRERRGGKKPAMTAGDVMAKECAAALRKAGL